MGGIGQQRGLSYIVSGIKYNSFNLPGMLKVAKQYVYSFDLFVQST